MSTDLKKWAANECKDYLGQEFNACLGTIWAAASGRMGVVEIIPVPDRTLECRQADSDECAMMIHRHFMVTVINWEPEAT